MKTPKICTHHIDSLKPEFTSTELTAVRHGTCVNTGVQFKSIALTKLLATDITLMSFHVRMSCHVFV